VEGEKEDSASYPGKKQRSTTNSWRLKFSKLAANRKGFSLWI
jgi:hypothetical protein